MIELIHPSEFAGIRRDNDITVPQFSDATVGVAGYDERLVTSLVIWWMPGARNRNSKALPILSNDEMGQAEPVAPL
jgi:hypothetical protein